MPESPVCHGGSLSKGRCASPNKKGPGERIVPRDPGEISTRAAYLVTTAAAMAGNASALLTAAALGAGCWANRS